jgi:hypothetical protein
MHEYPNGNLDRDPLLILSLSHYRQLVESALVRHFFAPVKESQFFYVFNLDEFYANI